MLNQTRQHKKVKVIYLQHALKAHIKLNTKRLYEADGLAVKEMIKITTVLYQAAMKLNKSGDEEHGTSKYHPGKFDFNSKLSDLKLARQLASEITVKGSSLHQLLGREVELRAIRRSCIAQPMDLNEIEKNVTNVIKSTQAEIAKTHSQLDNISSDEANLQAKIEKRKSELERNQKRLKSLESVRPAFMDEYENLEKDLQELYASYIEKYRNLAYLERVNEDMNKSEQNDDGSENPINMSLKAREENENLIRGNLTLGSSDEDEETQETSNKDEKKQVVPKPKMIGSLTGDLETDDESEGGSTATEDEDELLEGEEDDEEEANDQANDSDDNF
ncbi:clusterin-associated protein 1 isoform X2 [Hydra vulgaris]|uniref:clusterin-associated protein 1 isoform X2 n=1 Tax=Hydra vulgaris TaxID=6087 RepID=UPI001F5E9A29|nr:clusterin-associated protein 1 isoform X3 [Hydra vulgaris]